MDKRWAAWGFTIVGGAVTLFVVVGSLLDDDWAWTTDVGRAGKFLLAGPISLMTGLAVLRDAYGEPPGERARPRR